MSRSTISPLLAAAIEHYGEISAFVRRRVGCATTTDDIMQDMCLRLTRGGAVSIDNPRAYLFQTAANLTIDYQRAQRSRRLSNADIDALLHIPDEQPSPEDCVAARGDIAELQHALAELTERQRQIFRLSRLQRVAHSDIAARFGVTTRTVENEIRRALTHCAARLKKKLP